MGGVWAGTASWVHIIYFHTEHVHKVLPLFTQNSHLYLFNPEKEPDKSHLSSQSGETVGKYYTADCCSADVNVGLQVFPLRRFRQNWMNC